MPCPSLGKRVLPRWPQPPEGLYTWGLGGIIRDQRCKGDMVTRASSWWRCLLWAPGSRLLPRPQQVALLGKWGLGRATDVIRCSQREGRYG